MTQFGIFCRERSTRFVDLYQYESNKGGIMVRMMSSNVVKTIVMGKELFILYHFNVYLKLLKRICTNNHLEKNAPCCSRTQLKLNLKLEP